MSNGQLFPSYDNGGPSPAHEFRRALMQICHDHSVEVLSATNVFSPKRKKKLSKRSSSRTRATLLSASKELGIITDPRISHSYFAPMDHDGRVDVTALQLSQLQVPQQSSEAGLDDSPDPNGDEIFDFFSVSGPTSRAPSRRNSLSSLQTTSTRRRTPIKPKELRTTYKALGKAMKNDIAQSIVQCTDVVRQREHDSNHRNLASSRTFYECLTSDDDEEDGDTVKRYLDEKAEQRGPTKEEKLREKARMRHIQRSYQAPRPIIPLGLPTPSGATHVRHDPERSKQVYKAQALSLKHREVHDHCTARHFSSHQRSALRVRQKAQGDTGRHVVAPSYQVKWSTPDL